MSKAGPALCPACPEAAGLTPWRSEQVDATVSYCLDCGGVWIERQAIEVLGARKSADLLPLWLGSPPMTADQPGRFCPACGTLMERKACGEIVLEVCGSHGVWFDREELEHFMGWVRNRSEAHRRAVGAPVALGAAAIPSLPPEGDGSGWIDGASATAELLGCLVELVAGIFEIS